MGFAPKPLAMRNAIAMRLECIRRACAAEISGRRKGGKSIQGVGPRLAVTESSTDGKGNGDALTGFRHYD